MKNIYSFLLLLLPLFSFSQKQGNIWYFADSCGLDFNSGNPVVLTNGNIFSSNVTEGTATISDSSGHLLFYANGKTVWNRNHQVMPNGNGLMGGASSTQAAFIIPIPGNDSLFYLFTTDEFQHNLQNGLRYSIVNICMNGGYGDIPVGQKNILLLDTVAEKLCATTHANGFDYWLVTHKFYSDAFYAFHITSGGITDTIISHVGTYEPNMANTIGAAIGQMKISPDGTKLAWVFSNTNPEIAELLDFDNATGVISNPISLPTAGGEYGVSFSPDNSKLYISGLGSGSLVQYDISSGNPATIVASRIQLNSTVHQMSGMQLGPDGKIYIAGDTSLDVINNPNAAGLACNYVYNALNLGGHHSDYGITSFLDNYDYHNPLPKCYFADGISENTNQSLITLFPNPFSSSATLQFSSNVPYQHTQFELFDVFGKQVQSFQIENSSVQIEKGNLVSGIYFWTVKDGEKIIATGKIAVE